MKEEIKERFCSLEELKRTIDCYDGYSDNEEVYYFIGALRFAYDYITDLQDTLKDREEYCYGLETHLENLQEEIEKLNNIIDITKNNIDITIQIIKEQSTGNDEWILERLNGIREVMNK